MFIVGCSICKEKVIIICLRLQVVIVEKLCSEFVCFKLIVLVVEESLL